MTTSLRRKRTVGASLWFLVLALALTGACRPHPRRGPSLREDVTRPPAEWLKDENIRLLRDYVRIDTTSRGTGERAGALFLQKYFECAGIENELVCPVPDRCNVVARIPGRRREGALLLLNHIDVVAAYPQMWKEATPFGGDIKLGFLYGRGAYDMKSLGLCQAIAMKRLKESGITPETDILFLGEADEETDEKFGSRWMLEHRPEWFHGVAAVLNEGGTNEVILRDLRFWGLETLQAGYGSIEFEAGAREPLKSLAAAFPRLKGETVAPHPQAVEGFGMLANHQPEPYEYWLRNLDWLRTHRDALARLPDRYGSFLEPRIQWAGPYANPPGQDRILREYTVVFTPPGVSPDPYLDEVEREAGRRSIRVIERLSGGATVASPYPTPVTDVLKRVSLAFHSGIPFGPVPTAGGVTTSVYFRRLGIPAYGYSPILMNITDEARRHGNDERVFLPDYVEGIEIMDQVLKEYAFFPGNKTSAPPASN